MSEAEIHKKKKIHWKKSEKRLFAKWSLELLNDRIFDREMNEDEKKNKKIKKMNGCSTSENIMIYYI